MARPSCFRLLIECCLALASSLAASSSGLDGLDPPLSEEDFLQPATPSRIANAVAQPTSNRRCANMVQLLSQVQVQVNRSAFRADESGLDYFAWQLNRFAAVARDHRAN